MDLADQITLGGIQKKYGWLLWLPAPIDKAIHGPVAVNVEESVWEQSGSFVKALLSNEFKSA